MGAFLTVLANNETTRKRNKFLQESVGHKETGKMRCIKTAQIKSQHKCLIFKIKFSTYHLIFMPDFVAFLMLHFVTIVVLGFCIIVVKNDFYSHVLFPQQNQFLLALEVFQIALSNDLVFNNIQSSSPENHPHANQHGFLNPSI